MKGNSNLGGADDKGKTKAQLIAELERLRLELNEESTQRRRAEEAIREGEGRLKSIFEHSPSLVLLKNLEGRYMYVNDRHEDWFGIPGEAMIGRTVHEFYPKKSTDVMEVNDREVFRTGQPILFEHELPRTDGAPMTLMTTKFPVRDSTGAITGIGTIATDVTDHRRAEAELRENAALMRLLTDAVPVGISYVDRDQRYRFSSATHARWIGKSPEDVVGKRIDEVLTPEDYAQILPRIQASLAGERWEFEDKRIFPDGKTRTVHAVLIPDIAGNGEVRGYSAMIEDTTERRLAERAILESEAMIRAVIDSFPVPISVKDTDGRFTMINQETRTRTGDRISDLIGKTSFDLHDPPKAEMMEAQDREAMETRAAVEREYEVNFGGSYPRQVISTKFPILTGEGVVSGIGTIITDITDRKRAENALRESEERFKSIFEHSPSLIILKENDGRYRLVNARHDDFHGIPAAEMIGRKAHDMYPGEIADHFVAKDREVLATGRTVQWEQEMTRADGSPLFLINTKFPVRDHEGGIVGLGTISTDVTEQRRLVSQLRESQKLEALGQLAGGIAHDFNNLLQIITSYALLARDVPPNADTLPKFLENIIRAGNRAANLTRQLLTFSRRTVLQPVTIDFNELITDLLRMVERLIEENIELEFTRGGNLHAVLADEGMMEQVILNLCVNARDAMAGGGRISIATGNFEADQAFCDAQGWEYPGSYVMVSVSDNGTGMTSDVREHIFEPFYTTKEVGKGTGLGLSMVHSIVEQHQGRIEVTSEAGGGTTFRIYLPKAEGATPQEEVFASDEAPGGTETILIAEDEEGVRTLLSNLLQSKGYSVVLASDGHEAVERFRIEKNAVNLVILDVVMPRMKGTDAFERINELKPGIPVIFSTGYSDNVIDAEFLQRKGVRLLQKPYDPNNLFRAVRDMLDERE